MAGLLMTAGSVFGLLTLFMAMAWLFTPRRSPVRRFRRGVGTLLLAAISASFWYLAQRAAGAA